VTILDIVEDIKNVLEREGINVVEGAEAIEDKIFNFCVVEPEKREFESANVGVVFAYNFVSITCVVSAHKKNFRDYMGELIGLVNRVRDSLTRAMLNGELNYSIEFVRETYSEFMFGSEKSAGAILEIKVTTKV